MQIICSPFSTRNNINGEALYLINSVDIDIKEGNKKKDGDKVIREGLQHTRGQLHESITQFP